MSTPPPTSDQARAVLLRLAEMAESAGEAQPPREWLQAQAMAALAEEAERLAISNTAAALTATQRLVVLADGAGDSAVRARVRRARGQALAYANQSQDALLVLEEARRVATPEAPLECARAGVAMLHALARLGRLKEAVEIGELVHRELLALRETELAAKADVNLGVVHRMLDHPQTALEHFDRALPVFAGNPVIAAQIQSNRGEALLDLSSFAAAEQAFSEALAAFERAGVARAASIAEGNLADLLSRQGRYGKALFHFERARARLEQDAAAGDAARLAMEQAEAQFAVGLLQESRATYEHALPILDAHQLSAEAARARLGYARVLAALGDLNEAAARAREAMEAFTGMGQQAPAARARLVLGHIEVGAGRGQEAIALVSAAMEALAERPADLAQAHALLASACLDAGEGHTALRRSSEGLVLAERTGLPHIAAILRHLQGKALLALGREEDAAGVLEAAALAFDRSRGALSLDRFRAAFASAHSDVYGDAVAALLRAPTPEHVRRAFALVQRAKGGSLLDLLQTGSSLAADAAPPQALGELEHASSHLRALVSRMLESGGGGEREALAAKIREAEHRLDALQARALALGEYRELLGSPVELAAIQQAVPPGWALVEYFSAGSDLMAFVVSDSRLEHIRLGSLEQVKQALERFQFEISRAVLRAAAGLPPLRGSASVPLADLHQHLFSPILSRFGAFEGLVIAPSGVLHTVPFHALMHDGRCLGAEIPILQCPSGSVLVHLKQRQTPISRNQGALLVCADDDLAPGMAQEAESLARELPGAELLRGNEATLANVRRLCGGRGLVHLACHGAFFPGIPAASGMKLGDGWLTAREAASLPLAGAVVTLSGCDSGRVAVQAGDELSGLIRGLLAAGAQCVLGTLWPIHDGFTTELIGRAYRLWYAGGKTGGRSLANAFQEIRRECTAAGLHPAFWSPFFVIGAP